METIKINVEQIKELEPCIKRYDKALHLKEMADDECYNAKNAFWKKCKEIVPELNKLIGFKRIYFNEKDNCFEIRC